MDDTKRAEAKRDEREHEGAAVRLPNEGVSRRGLANPLVGNRKGLGEGRNDMGRDYHR